MDENYLEIIDKRKQIEILNIKNCNQYTSKYGLTLSDKQINDLLAKRTEILKEKGRVEFRGGILDKIIKEFSDSPYITQENYVETLYALIEMFYEYKNETMDLITDDELIVFMKKAFDGVCKGDIGYLEGTVMYKMRKDLLAGKHIDNIEAGKVNEWNWSYK